MIAEIGKCIPEDQFTTTLDLGADDNILAVAPVAIYAELDGAIVQAGLTGKKIYSKARTAMDKRVKAVQQRLENVEKSTREQICARLVGISC